MVSSLATLVLVLMLRFSGGAIAVSSSYISRTTEEQIIATVAPAAFADADADADDQSDDALGLPFLASPSGSFAAYLRRATVDDHDSTSGGSGDVCYVEVVQQQGGGGGTSSVWESECAPVGGADTCDLAFSPVGLELFAGGRSLWDTAADSDPEMLSLDGAGDMRIVSRDGVTVWRTRDEPWTGQRCGATLPVLASPSRDDVLPQPSATTGAKLLTPPVAASTLASPWGSDFSFGDQTAPPLDTEPDQVLPPPPPPADDEGSTDLPDMPLPLPPPPADDEGSTDLPDMPLPPPPPPPPADDEGSTDLPNMPLPPPPPPPPADDEGSTDFSDLPLPPPPPSDPSTYWPDLPLPPPPADTYPIPETPEQPLYSSPPPAPPTASVPPQTPLPPLHTPPSVPPPGASIASPPASSGGYMPVLPPPVGTPHPHPHHLPLGASPPVVPGAVAPISGGAGARLPFGQGQGQGQGVFGQQQNQVLNGGGQPLEESAGGWSGRERGGAAVSLALAGLVALFFGF